MSAKIKQYIELSVQFGSRRAIRVTVEANTLVDEVTSATMRELGLPSDETVVRDSKVYKATEEGQREGNALPRLKTLKALGVFNDAAVLIDPPSSYVHGVPNATNPVATTAATSTGSAASKGTFGEE